MCSRKPLNVAFALDRIRRKSQVLMGVENVFRTLYTLECWCNMGFVAPMYRYVQGKCPIEIKEMCPPIKSFNAFECLSQRSPPLVLELPVYRTTHYRYSSFFNPAALLDVSISNLNVHKYYSASFPNSPCTPFWSPPCSPVQGHRIHGNKKEENLLYFLFIVSY